MLDCLSFLTGDLLAAFMTVFSFNPDKNAYFVYTLSQDPKFCNVSGMKALQAMAPLVEDEADLTQFGGRRVGIPQFGNQEPSEVGTKRATKVPLGGAGAPTYRTAGTKPETGDLLFGISWHGDSFDQGDGFATAYLRVLEDSSYRLPVLGNCANQAYPYQASITSEKQQCFCMVSSRQVSRRADGTVIALEDLHVGVCDCLAMYLCGESPAELDTRLDDIRARLKASVLAKVAGTIMCENGCFGVRLLC